MGTTVDRRAKISPDERAMRRNVYEMLQNADALFSDSVSKEPETSDAPTTESMEGVVKNSALDATPTAPQDDNAVKTESVVEQTEQMCHRGVSRFHGCACEDTECSQADGAHGVVVYEAENEVRADNAQGESRVKLEITDEFMGGESEQLASEGAAAATSQDDLTVGTSVGKQTGTENGGDDEFPDIDTLINEDDLIAAQLGC